MSLWTTISVIGAMPNWFLTTKLQGVLLWLILLCDSATASGDLMPRDKSTCTIPSLADATSEELQAGLSGGCFTSADLTKAYIARIHEVNSALNVVLEINPDALDISKQLDTERAQGQIRGPLHGLPILIKDLIGTHDGMETAAGSHVLIGAKVKADSTVVAKLRESGAIILGKTNMSEWANFRSLNSSNGWNARGGQTYAAYYPNQDPLGSSSGSGVATDLGLALAALGTEVSEMNLDFSHVVDLPLADDLSRQVTKTSGSIILPSEKSNIVGIKPTVGLTSRYMVIPVSERQDTVGPMGRTVREAAILLQAIAGQDPNDNYTLAQPFGTKLPDYVSACKISGLHGKRIGIPRNVMRLLENGTSATVFSAFEEAVAVIKNAGATVIEESNFTAFESYLGSDIPREVVSADFLVGLANYFSNLSSNPNNIRNLLDVRNFTRNSPLEDYPSRDTALWDSAIGLGIDNTSPEFWKLYQKALDFGEEGGLLGALKRHRLDAVILPSSMATGIPGIIGTPVITVPLGAFPDGTPLQFNARGNLVNQAPGIPFGISFLGPKWSEETLIGMAYAFEQRTLARQKFQRYIDAQTELQTMLGLA